MHSKKLKRLGIIKNKNDRIMVYNLSSKHLNIEVTKILENGPKYVFSTIKYIENEDQVEAEYLITKLMKSLKNISSIIIILI